MKARLLYGRTRPGIFASARRNGLSGNVDDRVLYISFFDGSARPVSVTNAKARPDWWAPTGSEWVSLGGIAPEASDQYASAICCHNRLFLARLDPPKLELALGFAVVVADDER